MGRIKTQLVKRISNELVRDYNSILKKTFEENKLIVQDRVDVTSRKLRNIIAGYVTRIMKNRVE